MVGVRFSCGLFAIALASAAILSLGYGDFVPIGQSVATSIPWRKAWVCGSALLLLATGAGLCISRTALPSALTISGYQTVWTLTCALPIVSAPLSVGAWYGFCEPLTSLAGAWILYTMLSRPSQGSQLPAPHHRTLRVLQAVFGLTCVVYGWSHFVYADYTAGMVPAWLPARLAVAYFTGLAHIAAGAALVVGILPRLAATLEALMMSLFGLLVWVPSFFMQPRPAWALPPQNQWSELVVNLALAASAWVVATSLKSRPWGFAARSNTAL
jgi:uncharacterized membrane protein